jgi:hypothetical protein
MSNTNDTGKSTSNTSSAQAEPTPGPWVARQLKAGDYYVEDIPSAVSITGQVRSNTGAFSDEAEANAHLIAAAPRLLSELEEVHDLLVRLKATHGHLVRRELIDNVEEALATARNEEA